jgi:hypothetical protein
MNLFSCPIPTLASKPNCECSKGLGKPGVPMANKMANSFTS